MPNRSPQNKRKSIRQSPDSKNRTRVTKAYHHGNLRTALVSAGVHILEKEGLKGLSIRAVARAVGVSHAAPINHFPDLRSLLTAIATAGCMAMHERKLAGLLAAGHQPFLRLRATGMAYIGFAREHPEWFRLMWRTDLLDPQNDDMNAARSANWSLLTATMNDFLMSRGRDSALLEPRLLLAFAVVHGLSVLEIEGGLNAMKIQPLPNGHDHALVVLDLLAEAFAAREGA